MMLGGLLDGRLRSWDERRAAGDDAIKKIQQFEVGAEIAFPGSDVGLRIAELLKRVAVATLASGDFYDEDGADSYKAISVSPTIVDLVGTSRINTESTINNIVTARVFEARRAKVALVILPHWNADPRKYHGTARYMALAGVTTAVVALPYHGTRADAAACVATGFLSPNLGRTIRSVRQAVVDTRAVVSWLFARGYLAVVPVGVSLGSCVASLVAAHDRRVVRTALLLTAGDFAEVVWTGRATRAIKESLCEYVTLEDLRRAWSIISPSTFVESLARDNHQTLVISAQHDEVVKPYLTNRFLEELNALGAALTHVSLRCGHYSLQLFPFNLIAGARVLRFGKGALELR